MLPDHAANACAHAAPASASVSPALHTPLMSVTNAISGIIIVGAIVQITTPNVVVQILSAIAVLVASINIFGGFAVTRRMLAMFQKGDQK